MWLPIALAIAVLGTLSRTVRRTVGGLVFWPCVVVALITLYGMTLP